MLTRSVSTVMSRLFKRPTFVTAAAVATAATVVFLFAVMVVMTPMMFAMVVLIPATLFAFEVGLYLFSE